MESKLVIPFLAKTLGKAVISNALYPIMIIPKLIGINNKNQINLLIKLNIDVLCNSENLSYINKFLRNLIIL